MSAPATHHDLRCVQVSSPDPSVPCTCSRGSVLRLPLRPDPRACLMCGGLPYWLIQSGDRQEDRSCRSCLDPALDLIFLDRWDGFTPITVTRLRTGGAA